MADSEQASFHGGTLEALQGQSLSTRRMRPPELDLGGGDENRVPLRNGKLHKRESKIGLRSLFGRSKTAIELDVPASHREVSRPAGIRASLAEISNWPYGLHGARSELVLSTQARPFSAADDVPQRNPLAIRSKKSASSGKQQSAPPPMKPVRGSLATWDPPPLFQAYPQAIKHAQLPSSTISSDALLRFNDRKGNSSLREDLTQVPLTPELADDQTGDKSGEKARKRHRRNTSASSNKFEWTTKIYVLVTSGYLLQYSGEGSFDRLPEKMLHLGKDSAAFVSDAIPGRHWVLQVSSVMDSDGQTTSQSRSFLSRFPFRSPEKRNASNFLMVFETAEEMEMWITTLRREIEALGGKKTLSETGKPKAEDNVLQLRAQPSQRTLVVRDPDRFSRVISQDFSWQNEQADDLDGSVTVVDPDATPEQSLDDISTTNSVISHDGQQLDGLRDSSHRLSYISSGQRTIITSAGSSPSCSPTRDTFPSHDEEPPFQELRTEVQLRPNAAAIMDRRQSMLSMNPLVESRSMIARPHSSYSTSSDSAPPTVINFSVPHSAGRRFSVTKTSPLDSAPFVPGHFQDRDLPPRPLRRAPPTALPISRPLSIVADQPSPIQDETQVSPNPEPAGNSQEDQDSDARASSRPVSRVRADSRNANPFNVPDRESSLGASEHHVTLILPKGNSPRKLSSTQSLPTFQMPPPPLPPPKDVSFEFLTKVPRRPQSRTRSPLPASDEAPLRSRSSTGHYSRARSQSPAARKAMHKKRASLQATGSDRPPRFSTSRPPDIAMRVTSPGVGLSTRSPPPLSWSTPATPALTPAPSAQHLQVDAQTKALLNRRSMPHLVEGPPPAPPPTCALPPIPQKVRVKG